MAKEILNQQEQDKVSQAVARAEKKTSGEIVPALIRESSDYASFELTASLLAGFLYFCLLLLFHSSVEQAVKGLFWNSPDWYVTAFFGLSTVVVIGVAYFFSNLAFVDRLIVPGKTMREAVRNRALRHFTESGVYATRDRTGILLFVSLLERRVEILADKGISEKIPQAEWEDIARNLAGSIREGRLADGLCRAVESCGEKLAKHFPIQPDDTNELPDSPDLLES